MYLATHRDGNSVVLKVEGRIDGNNATEFQEEFMSAISDSDRIAVIDCQGLTFISSAGLRAILLISKDMRRVGARLAVCSLTSEVKQVFILSGFQKLIPIHDSLPDALQ